jgi:hypothetical protein
MNKRTVVMLATLAALLDGPALAQQIGVNNVTGQETQLGANLTPQAGETVCTMSASLADQVAAHQPNGGLMVQQFSPTPCTGTVVATPAPPAPTATPTAPTLALGAPAGTSAAASFISGSNNQRGAISITAGTSPSVGIVLTVTFPQTYATVPAVLINDVGVNAAAVSFKVRNITTSQVTIAVLSAMTNGQSYVFDYLVVP